MYNVDINMSLFSLHLDRCVCSEPIKVWCDMETDGGGWTVITNRLKEGSGINFNRTWTDYQAGFGNISSEFWMGEIFQSSSALNANLNKPVLATYKY